MKQREMLKVFSLVKNLYLLTTFKQLSEKVVDLSLQWKKMFLKKIVKAAGKLEMDKVIKILEVLDKSCEID